MQRRDRLARGAARGGGGVALVAVEGQRELGDERKGRGGGSVVWDGGGAGGGSGATGSVGRRGDGLRARGVNGSRFEARQRFTVVPSGVAVSECCVGKLRDRARSAPAVPSLVYPAVFAESAVLARPCIPLPPCPSLPIAPSGSMREATFLRLNTPISSFITLTIHISAKKK